MNGNGVWRWIAISLAAFMMGGVPGYLYQYINTPTKEELKYIQEQQSEILQRMVRLETQIISLQVEVASLKESK